MENIGTKVYTVINGYCDEAPDEVVVVGTFRTREAAIKRRNEMYLETNYLSEEEAEETGPSLNSSYIDDGSMFWAVVENELL